MKLFKIRFPLILAIIFSLASPQIKAQVNTQDSLALVDLYNSTDGPNWINCTKWLLTAPVSSWSGINVSGGRITSIVLIQKALSGIIPPSLGNLTNLTTLDLSLNGLNDSIPASFGNLTNLRYLQLSGNQLTGSIPSSLGNLTNLTTLYLYQNKLSGSIPSSLGNLINLTDLELWKNQLSDSIPSSLGNLTNLTTLGLNYNNLSGSIPSSLGNLTNLTYLQLSVNQLSGSIPSSLGNLTNLSNLDLGYNRLSGSIPSSLGNLKNLSGFWLSYNQLRDSIPSSFGRLTNLIDLNIFYNKFTFAGMEGIVNIVKIWGGSTDNVYSPQATIPVNNNGHILSVSVGGTPSNDTFRWYKDSVLVATKVVDSTYSVTSNGKYWVVATNSVATQLTLYSDTINIIDLPVTLSSFTASTNNNTIKTNWHTATELNTSHFIIQHSTDGSSFTDIGTVKAIGSGANSYSFIDTHPADGTNYYRLESVDKDGSSSYSKVVSVQFTVNSNQLTVYPNPAKEAVTIKGNHIASLQLIDNMGRVVKAVSLRDATNPVLSVSSLAAGVYHLRIQTTDGKVIGRELIIYN